MKCIILILAIISCSIASPVNKNEDQNRIIGGEEAPKRNIVKINFCFVFSEYVYLLDEFPWQISLRILGIHDCGGSIINKNQVITAANCVKNTLIGFETVN